ncbi:sideroflexin-2 isoform X2 [Chionomys nivalis]|uniref:sideroflexin-2 isoform X2 n=1 Tax=Chionomys nivalis TaxID=269649 RepID=UPI00259384E6|nr:sideroflexin-2 isoform X2 [Chionomys nivalis]
MEADLSGFNIDAPRWDQRMFLGRVKHFFNITDPRTIFASEQELDWAKAMVEKSRMGLVPPGTQVEQLLYAKKLYDSAFHPDTGEKMNVIGRMSFQVPGGMIITGFMLQFYRTMPAVIFWQWVNQSFNALVNYTNRNAASPTSVSLTTCGHGAAGAPAADEESQSAARPAAGLAVWLLPPLHGASGMWALPSGMVSAIYCLLCFIKCSALLLTDLLRERDHGGTTDVSKDRCPSTSTLAFLRWVNGAPVRSLRGWGRSQE